MKKLFFYFLALTAVLFTSCKGEEEPTVILEDGIYVTGTAASANVDSKYFLQAGRIEGEGFASQARVGMYESIVYLTAGNFNFTEYKATPETKTVWGISDLKVKKVTETLSVDSGKVVSGATTVLAIKTAGLYHVVFDKTAAACMVVPVKEFGIIGEATPTGWNSSTKMTQKKLDATGAEWELTNIEIKKGLFKYRYNDIWKVENFAGVTVFTNAGGDGTYLVMGENGNNTTVGKFTVLLSWAPGKGLTSKLTKTGDIAMTNWTNCELELVGSGVDATNVGAKADATSGWNWGNTLSAGKPTKVGNVYTWTWDNVKLLVDGFKIRTIDAKESGGVGGFDVGYGILDKTASSTEIEDNSGNFKAKTAGTYKIVMTIDAADGDTKKAVITKK